MSPSNTNQPVFESIDYHQDPAAHVQPRDRNLPGSFSSTHSHTHSNDERTDDDRSDSGFATPDTGSLYDERPIDPAPYDIGQPKPKEGNRRSSTVLITKDTEDIQKLLNNLGGETRIAQQICCGGGCCQIKRLKSEGTGPVVNPVHKPQNNQAYDALNLFLGELSYDSELTDITALPEKTVSFTNAPPESANEDLGPKDMPPIFVEPHSPYKVYRAPLRSSRELTKPGAEKRTYHFEIDVTNYPPESGSVDFVVGGAIGLCPANADDVVEDVFNCLGVPKTLRDKRIILHTTGGRWPTIWGEEQPRDLLTTRRELLRWCSDLQSTPPTKPLLRLLAEHATAENEKKILMFLCSAQGQGSFCDLSTSTYTTVPQLLHAFPSSQPPLDHLLSVLSALMPRFYSLSHDPIVSTTACGKTSQRCVETAVTVHDCPHYLKGHRTGVASGFLQSIAHKFMEAQEKGGPVPELYIPMFRGLMANPLAREFTHDGPMLLIGAGVGIAPFRGFVQRRLKSANCANKVWVLQGIRDSLLDELYSGEWGVHEDKIKKVVQSRVGEGLYVQEEVRNQADLVWFVINSLDGKIYICGSSKGMGEGVEQALIDVAMMKGLNRQSAIEFWEAKKLSGQCISVSAYPTP